LIHISAIEDIIKTIPSTTSLDEQVPRCLSELRSSFKKLVVKPTDGRKDDSSFTNPSLSRAVTSSYRVKNLRSVNRRAKDAKGPLRAGMLGAVNTAPPLEDFYARTSETPIYVRFPATISLLESALNKLSRIRREKRLDALIHAILSWKQFTTNARQEERVAKGLNVLAKINLSRTMEKVRTRVWPVWREMGRITAAQSARRSDGGRVDHNESGDSLIQKSFEASGAVSMLLGLAESHQFTPHRIEQQLHPVDEPLFEESPVNPYVNHRMRGHRGDFGRDSGSDWDTESNSPSPLKLSRVNGQPSAGAGSASVVVRAVGVSVHSAVPITGNQLKVPIVVPSRAPPPPPLYESPERPELMNSFYSTGSFSAMKSPRLRPIQDKGSAKSSSGKGAGSVSKFTAKSPAKALQSAGDTETNFHTLAASIVSSFDPDDPSTFPRAQFEPKLNSQSGSRATRSGSGGDEGRRSNFPSKKSDGEQNRNMGTGLVTITELFEPEQGNNQEGGHWKSDVNECVLCNRMFHGYGNNPEPCANSEDGDCCDDCNKTKVIPTRMRGNGTDNFTLSGSRPELPVSVMRTVSEVGQEFDGNGNSSPRAPVVEQNKKEQGKIGSGGPDLEMLVGGEMEWLSRGSMEEDEPEEIGTAAAAVDGEGEEYYDHDPANIFETTTGEAVQLGSMDLEDLWITDRSPSPSAVPLSESQEKRPGALSSSPLGRGALRQETRTLVPAPLSKYVVKFSPPEKSDVQPVFVQAPNEGEIEETTGDFYGVEEADSIGFEMM
jgi:hypothetical protein